jgi:hypothetical protein
MDELQIFDFERDFAGSLRCIPMIVRFKLDHSGVKLTLRQWSRFGRDAREQLVRMPCDAPDEITAYRAFLIRLIEACADEPVKTMEIDAQPEWACVDHVPERVIGQAHACSLEPPCISLWSAWTPLQRFALFKLTRAGHDNDNFAPALREFTTTMAALN